MPLLLLALLACGTPDPTDDTDTASTEDTAATVPSDESNRDGDCIFNRNCPADQRCECTDGLCACADGVRGTGVNGVDTCTDGNDCASSLCVEGSDGSFYCSDECGDDGDCEAALPDCLDVAFIGRICTREAPAR